MQKTLLITLLLLNTISIASANTMSLRTYESKCQTVIPSKTSLSKVNIHKNYLKNEINKLQKNCELDAIETVGLICSQDYQSAIYDNSTPANVKTNCTTSIVKKNGRDFQSITCTSRASLNCLQN